ncbi:protein KIAA0100-like, partial [Ostrinia furnacalis]|uniref:protein KIAA0100-like n=1 Tax=Ostrinia furnacalis TaxID=93504 RepID=UPI001040A329
RSVNVDSIRVVFPYKHRFADAVQGDFVSLFKWVKLVHAIKKKPFTAESPLPSDLHIKIQEILIEMSDDPFEVKLRDNYELLEDEYKESQKRRTMLDAKVQELCKPHLFLPAGKVEELYSALRQKDAQIYVQRCRAAPPPRTRLVACCLSGFRLIALADPSIHGAQNAQAKMRDIDFDSPWPEDGMEFTTLWARGVQLGVAQWQLLLRDFPQPLLSCRGLRMWGTVAAAEDQPPPRAVRTVTIDQGAPWGPYELERSMMPLKWYYDLCCEMAQYSYAFGPCWEPVIAHCNLSFDQVSRPSLDPSAPLAWWDKVRLLMHGRLTANIARFTCLLHVSLDPYNTTEEMELTWSDLVLDWTNGKLGFLGELNVFVRTASKYDDCRVLRVPALRLCAKLGWQCVGDPRDHHAQAPCAPTRLPEYSSNQEHDSYRAFRSQGLDIHLSMETKPIDRDGPVLLLYGSTLRWFESLKLILSGVTRPTRRGRVFNNVRPRKPQLSRHYRNVSVSLTLHNLQVFYWSSSSMQRGIEMLGVRVTCGSKHRLTLVPASDGLLRRPRANWTTVYMNCDLNDAEIWLKTTAAVAEDKDNDANSSVLRPPEVEKWYCVSVRRVSYGREAAGAGAGSATHRLAVHDLRGAWTKLNRDLAFALIDTYIKTQQLKKNLSTKALKEEEKPNSSPKREADVVSPPPSNAQCQSANTSGAGEGAGGMLAALVAEAGGEAPVVFSDELSGDAPAHPPPHAHHKQLDDDTAHTAFLIELVNSQVVLKGCETRGYVLLCAARAEVRQRVRRSPPATAWCGALSAMQYYATVSAALGDQLDENIQWVSVEEISERWAGTEISTLPDVPRLVGSGHSAGGVIGRTVGPSADTGLAQLQRIVSRCACEFYYASHEEVEQCSSTDAWGASSQPYDSFMLMHHDLDVCTNSLQVSARLPYSCEGYLRRILFFTYILAAARPRGVQRRAERHKHQKQLDHDTAHTAFLIELVNSQVVLKGCETRGYVLLCAARAEVRQRVRRSPPATAWCGALSAMQYYATVSAALGDQLDENIQWVSVEEISERWAGTEISTLPDVPRLVGSGHSAGGVIGRTVGPSADTGLAQLQRIVSRCACEFYYASHEEVEQCSSTDAWGASSQPYDSFMLMHHDLDVCTNSLQYAMLLDVVNNVVLHVEPERRRTLERRARMRFQLQLHRDADPRQLIHKLQTQVRESLARLRRLEKEYYLKNRSITGDDPVAFEELKSLDNQVNECKEVVRESLARLRRLEKEYYLKNRSITGDDPVAFEELKSLDNQTACAMIMRVRRYTKTSRSDDSVEHQLEVGYVRVTNLLPNEPFPEVLVPQAPSGRAPLARRAALRVFCRDRPPVGGIAVKEHFEVNIVPIRIARRSRSMLTCLNRPARYTAGPGAAAPHRYNEICFKSARWRLTDADGQLGIADLLLTNFLYTKTSRSDDSVEHQLEVGYVRVTNLLPNEPFPEVLVPQAPSGRAPLARRAALRVFCRDRPPVGGIAVKEHFEVNIVPIRIGLTKKFFNTMLKFCFPERDPESIEDGDDEEGARSGLVPAGSKKAKKKPKDSNSNFYVKRDKKDKDDVEKMKERAEKNKLFIYIKIPEVPVRVSYKGSKEKNLEDVRDLPLVLPTLEYHNVTWTWLDLLLATKSDTRRVILSQAIRQKLQLHRRAAAAPEPHEEDKARLLLGERTVSDHTS